MQERIHIPIKFAMESLMSTLSGQGNDAPTMTVPMPEEQISTEEYCAKHPEVDDLFPDSYFDVIDDLYRPQSYPKYTPRPTTTDDRNSPLALRELLTPNAPPEIATQNQSAIDYRAGNWWFGCRLPKEKRHNPFFDPEFFKAAFAQGWV